MKLPMLAFALLLTVPVHAQALPAVSTASLPDTPKPKFDRLFKVQTVALGAGAAFDFTVTSHVLSLGGTENDWVFGRHPSGARLAGVGGAYFAAQVTGFYFTEHSRRRWVRWVGRAYIAFVTEEHFRLGACDLRMRNACHPLF